MIIAPPTAWMIRKPISQSAPADPVYGSNGSASAASAKTAKPAFYILTRP
jgi:hypothetical protein